MKIFLDSIGCRLNQSEIEKYASQFRAAGHTIVDSAAEADMVVINTCSVTNAAASDSRQKIRQAGRAGQNEIVVTGCWSTLEPGAAAQLPRVTHVVSNLEKDFLVPEVLGLEPAEFDLEPLVRQPLPGIHLRTRAFIKAQDGCDNHCTFCITRLARGQGRSQTVAQVVRDVQLALEGGAKEIVLSGVHLGSWGQDLGEALHLRDLISVLLRETDVQRLRLSSLEPWDLDENFFTLWQDERMCRHLHLPLQSGCAKTLKRMARNTTPEAYAEIVRMARAAAADMAITTDIIVGFPGEDEVEFQESLAFVQQMDFSAGHVFTYSSRPGTPATRLSGQVKGPEAKSRNARMRDVLAASAEQFQERFIGKIMPVLWESSDEYGPAGWRLHGLTDNYIRVEASSAVRLWNEISPVQLLGKTAEGLRGIIQPAAEG